MSKISPVSSFGEPAAATKPAWGTLKIPFPKDFYDLTEVANRSNCVSSVTEKWLSWKGHRWVPLRNLRYFLQGYDSENSVSWPFISNWDVTFVSFFSLEKKLELAFCLTNGHLKLSQRWKTKPFLPTMFANIWNVISLLSISLCSLVRSYFNAKNLEFTIELLMKVFYVILASKHAAKAYASKW